MAMNKTEFMKFWEQIEFAHNKKFSAKQYGFFYNELKNMNWNGMEKFIRYIVKSSDKLPNNLIAACLTFNVVAQGEKISGCGKTDPTLKYLVCGHWEDSKCEDGRIRFTKKEEIIKGDPGYYHYKKPCSCEAGLAFERTLDKR